MLANDVLVGTVGGTTAAAAIQVARSFRQLGGLATAVDLLNYQRLHPFGRVGLRCSLLFAAAISLLLLVFITRVGPLLMTMVPVGMIAGIALIWPSLGVRHAIKLAREATLSDLAKKLDVVDEIADKVQLLQYRSFIESVPAWSFDAPVVVRFLLYGVIPIGSWVLAALVEHAVDSAFR